MNLHAQIMNLQAPDYAGLLASPDYAAKIGHREARHAASELALKADAEREETIRVLRNLLAGNEYKTLEGLSGWHMKQVPRDIALTDARHLLATLEGRELVSG